MKDTIDLTEIQSKTGIKDFNKVTAKEFEKIQTLAAQHEITKQEIKLLVEVMPNFVQLQQNYVDGLKSAINAAKETQKDALRGISITLEGITDILKSIVTKSETEELRAKIADISLKLADYGIEIAKIIQETNKENNNTWKYVTGGLGVAALAVVGLFLRRK